MGMIRAKSHGLSNSRRPKCPQPPFPLRLEDELIGLPPGVASHSEDIFDEFNCLNLNVTTPAEASATSNLPVLIYIHGGGGFSGSNGDWWCDGGSIVKRSMEIGKPVISVVIKYVYVSVRSNGGRSADKRTATDSPSSGTLAPKSWDQHTGKKILGIKVYTPIDVPLLPFLPLQLEIRQLANLAQLSVTPYLLSSPSRNLSLTLHSTQRFNGSTNTSPLSAALPAN
jgi:hypothetical protein